MSFFISTSYTKFDTTGNVVNALFSIVLAFVIISFPIFVGVFYTKNFKKIIREDPNFKSRWGSLIEPLNFKRGGKRVILYPVLSLVRKLILAATLVFAQDATIFLTILSCVSQVIIIVILIGGIVPMKRKGDQRMLLLNETFVMLTIYCNICYTDFNPDYDAVIIMGNVQVCITVINIAINIFRMLYLSGMTLFRKGKLSCLKCKRDKAIKARIQNLKHIETEKELIAKKKQLEKGNLLNTNMAAKDGQV